MSQRKSQKTPDAPSQSQRQPGGPSAPSQGHQQPGGPGAPSQGQRQPGGPGAPSQNVPSIDEVKQTLRQAVKREKLSLETLLAKAGQWFWKDKTLYISFKNAFEMNMAKKDLSYLREKAVLLLGKEFSVEIVMAQATETQNKEKSEPKKDEVVDRFLYVFRGQVIQKGE